MRDKIIDMYGTVSIFSTKMKKSQKLSWSHLKKKNLKQKEMTKKKKKKKKNGRKIAI